MSEHTMTVRCVYCGTDKPPLKNETEHRESEPLRCSECGESGFIEDFYILETSDPTAMAKVANRIIWDEKLQRREEFTNKIREEGRQAGIEEGRILEREAVSRYFRKAGKPYYAVFFKEGEHLK